MFRLATNNDVPRIQEILVSAIKLTYKNLYSQRYISLISEKYYNADRLLRETSTSSKEWSGYYILEDHGKIVGCIGGGIDFDNIAEIYVLYLDPQERRKGYGTLLVDHFTKYQKDTYSINRQRVNVAQGNTLGIPFYEKMGFVQSEIIKTDSSDDNESYYSINMIRNI